MTNLIIEEKIVSFQQPHYDNSNIKSLYNLSFFSQNLNSLNLSTDNYSDNKVDKFSSKINYLLKLKGDFVLLQDLRNHNDSLHKIEKEIVCSKYGSYSIYINSTKNKRGVAILINNKLDCKVLRSYSSLCENFLGLDIVVNNFRFLLCSVYGPYESEHRFFYKEIKDKIKNIGIEYFLLGGDLNAIPTITPPNLCPLYGNLDCYKMASLPNPSHCNELYNWTTSDFATDVFRYLSPDRIDFSYIPFGDLRDNKSRIDIFLASSNMIGIFGNCDYLANKLSIFDHKTISLLTLKKTHNNQKQIDITLLNLEGYFETIEFYVYELILENFNVPNKNFLRLCLARIRLLNFEKVALLNCTLNSDALVREWINIKDQAIFNLCQNFPSMEDLFNCECIISPSLFIELLLNVIKNETISFQLNYRKKLNSYTSELKDKLYSLKKVATWHESNMSSINSIESELSKIEDEKTTRSMQDSKYFHIMNSEKGSKHFSKIVKNSKKNNSIDFLKDESGNEFADIKSRNDFLVNFFKNKFSRPPSTNLSLTEFMGDTINHPLIEQHKLTDHERDSIEGEITLEELDVSLNSSNFSSAIGPDFVHIRLIKKFWKILRLPIKKAFNEMISRKTLNCLMRCSKISLISKNGDVDHTSIKSLRPIASLTHLYKLFSGVFVNRIKKYSDKLNHKSQKGYSSKYSIQEGLIFTYEIINKALKSNTPLGILNLDFSSAFDSISHDYIKEAFKFHNFGPFMINFLITCLSDRYAHISTPDGITENFVIKVGSLQGDRSSPDVFKIALNPLSLKLVLSNNMKIPPQIPYNHVASKNSADSCKAFADDMDLFFPPSISALDSCNKNLTDFGNVSGLKLNRNKTKICLIGDNICDNFKQHSLYLGFKIESSFKMLGICFDNKLNLMNSNWDKVLGKMVKIRNFWAIFGLTIVGKINITKCFLYPQITYLGSVIAPTDEILMEIENIFVRFITQGTPIARDKIFTTVEDGGLGLARPRDFLKSLDVLLFKKSLSIHDSWSIEIKYFAINENDRYHYNSAANFEYNPILHRIISSYMDFASSYWLTDNNIMDLRLYDNILFTDSMGNRLTKLIFTGTTWNRYSNTIELLKFENMIGNDFKLLTREGFQDKNNISVNIMEFFRLSSFFRHNYNKYKSKIGNKCQSIDNFLKNKNLKSKNFRKFMINKNTDLDKVTTILNRYKWANMNIVDVDRESKWLNLWNISFLPIEIRNFFLCHLNNSNKFNVHLSKFNQAISPGCTFCTLSKNLPPPRETIEHFYSCQISTSFAHDYFAHNFRVANYFFHHNDLLIGAPTIFPDFVSFIINIELVMMGFFLSKCRVKRKLPIMYNFVHFTTNLRELFRNNSKYSRKYARIIFDPG